MGDDFVLYMYGRVRKAQFGEWRNLKYREKKGEYRKQNDVPKRCEDCNDRLYYYGIRRNWSVDHIIPLWVCRDYGLPELEFDFRNWRIICMTCNYRRGLKEITLESLSLPAPVMQKLLSLQPI